MDADVNEPITYSPTIEARGADAEVVARLSSRMAKDRQDFERNVRAAMAKELPRRSLERALAAAMGAAGEMRWGKDDCALWCANILHDALGYDGAARFRGRYRTRIGAGRVLGKAGLAGALRAAGRKHGWRLITEGQEMVGDIGIAVLNDMPSTVICRAPGWFIGRNESGWTALPAASIRVIWAVV